MSKTVLFVKDGSETVIVFLFSFSCAIWKQKQSEYTYDIVVLKVKQYGKYLLWIVNVVWNLLFADRATYT